MTRYQEQVFAQRERAILDAALGLFDTVDWQNVTVERIAAEVGVAKGTIYKHFASKEEIYARLALDVHRASVAKLEALPGDRPASQRIEDIISVFWERTMLPRPVTRVVQYCARDDFRRTLEAETRSRFEGLDARFGAVVAEVLEDGIRDGEFADRPLDRLVFPAQAALTGAIQMVWGGCLGAADPEEFRQELVRFILAGLCSEASAAA